MYISQTVVYLELYRKVTVVRELNLCLLNSVQAAIENKWVEASGWIRNGRHEMKPYWEGSRKERTGQNYHCYFS